MQDIQFNIILIHFSHSIILKLFIIFITKKLIISNYLFVSFENYDFRYIYIGFVHDMYIKKSREFYV